MKRITEVKINNFKFFPESEPIKIDGKNILLYGENGSGKSSFYWALYTLLECSAKDSVNTIKYFNKNNPSSLVNVHAIVDEEGVGDSFIKITLADNSSLEVSHQNTSINNDSNAKESLLASDFLNYKLLQRAYVAKHSEEIDLFPLFEDAVLNYVQFSDTTWHTEGGTPTILNDAGAIFNVVAKGPDQEYPNKNGKMGYPQKGAHNPAYTEFKNLVERFERDLAELIEGVNLRVNPVIQEKLKFNISFRLSYEIKSAYKLSEANYTPPVYRIKLVVDDFNGCGPVAKPQSYLNEARLSAIALAIRLAILERRLQDADVKILVLDDLLISLDMSNRDKIVKLILNEYAMYHDGSVGRDVGHQTFILTHDRSLFTFIKNDIANLPKSKADNWKLIEMYADELDENNPLSFEKPTIFYDQNDLAIAIKHYKNHDYPAAANYLRKYAEEILSKWLPEFCWKDKESKEKSNNKMPFQNILDNAINVFWPSFPLDCPEYKHLRKYLRILLNPLSHADVGVERYKAEIKQVIDIINQINSLHASMKLKKVVAGGEIIQIRQTKATGDLCIGIYELSNSFYELTDGSNQKHYSTFNGKITSWELRPVSGTTTSGLISGQDKFMKINHSDFIKKHSLLSSANWRDDLYQIDGTKLL